MAICPKDPAVLNRHRIELASVIEARQRLDSQLSENELVLKVCDSADFQATSAYFGVGIQFAQIP